MREPHPLDDHTAAASAAARWLLSCDLDAGTAGAALEAAGDERRSAVIAAAICIAREARDSSRNRTLGSRLYGVVLAGVIRTEQVAFDSERSAAERAAALAGLPCLDVTARFTQRACWAGDATEAELRATLEALCNPTTARLVEHLHDVDGDNAWSGGSNEWVTLIAGAAELTAGLDEGQRKVVVALAGEHGLTGEQIAAAARAL